VTPRPPTTVLAFDFGERRIGVAVGQTVTSTASPLGSVPVRHGRPDWEAIAALLEAWAPDMVVVGLPLNLDGTEQPLTRRARRFGNQLAGRWGLPVELEDERLSTREARSRLLAEGRPRADDDPVAAQVILEAWLAGQASACRRPAGPA
jgi:putative holliday junction resolvase